MAQNYASQSVVDVFKRRYGGVNQLTFKSGIVNELFPFSQSAMIGDSYIEAAILGFECGVTAGGPEQDLIDLNDAVPGAVRQARIKSSGLYLRSAMSYPFISRAAQAGAQAMEKSMDVVVQNNLLSHDHFLQILKLHGQRASEMGYVSFDPSGTIYRDAQFSGSGTITLTRSNGTTIAFTNGVATGVSLDGVTVNAILLRKGYYSAGIWTGKKNAIVEEVDTATSTVVASGTVYSTDSNLGILYVNSAFIPVVASSQTSHTLRFKSFQAANVMAGAQIILTNVGTLFEISAAAYELWQGSTINVNNQALSLSSLLQGIASATNRGGLNDGEEIEFLVNPRTFHRMVNDQAALTRYGGERKAVNGFEAIQVLAGNGANRIYQCNLVMEGEAYGFFRKSWLCSGSQAPAFRVAGMGGEDLTIKLTDQNGIIMQSYSDEFIFCRMPAKSLYFYNIDDEAVQQ